MRSAAVQTRPRYCRLASRSARQVARCVCRARTSTSNSQAICRRILRHAVRIFRVVDERHVREQIAQPCGNRDVGRAVEPVAQLQSHARAMRCSRSISNCTYRRNNSRSVIYASARAFRASVVALSSPSCVSTPVRSVRQGITLDTRRNAGRGCRRRRCHSAPCTGLRSNSHKLLLSTPSGCDQAIRLKPQRCTCCGLIVSFDFSVHVRFFRFVGQQSERCGDFNIACLVAQINCYLLQRCRSCKRLISLNAALRKSGVLN